MEEPRYNMLKDVEIILRSRIQDSEVFNGAVSEIQKLLQKYEISNKCSKEDNYQDENLKLISRWKACLLIEGKSPKTIEQYDFRMRHMLSHINLNFKDVGPYDIRFYLAMLKQNGCCNRTLEVVRNYINSFYKWMVIEGYVEKNPCENIKPIKYTESLKKVYTELDIEKIRCSCKNVKERAIVELFLSSGIRVSEMEQMNISDVDFKNNVVHVKHGKGDKERITYMSPVASYYINKYLDTRDDNDAELFKSINGRLKSEGIRWILHSIGDRSGVENVHPHRFRRTFATNLNTRGMAVQNIQYLLGHSNVDTTMLYININDVSVNAEYKKLLSF